MGSRRVDTPRNVDRTGDLGSILGIWAHPDDEAWLSSGLMMRAVEAGHRVVCVTATRGESGFPADDGRSAEERKAVRAAELDSLPLLRGAAVVSGKAGFAAGRGHADDPMSRFDSAHHQADDSQVRRRGAPRYQECCRVTGAIHVQRSFHATTTHPSGRGRRHSTRSRAMAPRNIASTRGATR